MQWLASSLLLVALGAATGCSDDRRPPKSDSSRNDLEPRPPRVRDDGGARSCTRAGCACDDEGATRDCGTVKEQVAGYLWCSLGLQVCEGGAWSECKSERIVLSKQLRNLRVQALGESRSCADENPCSPGCQLFQDDAGGLPLEPGAGLIEEEEGLMLDEVPGGAGTGCTGIEVTPRTTDLELTSLSPVSPNSTTFSARLTPEGCAGSNRRFAWSVNRPDLATVSETGVVTVAGPVAGPVEVSALAGGGLSGSATLNVRVAVQDTTQAPPDAPTNFGDDGEAPDVYLSWLYPYAETVFPPNVNAPLLQWSSVATAEASRNGGCALRADGSVRCWGTNVYGEIADRPGPYVQLSGRSTHFCALSPSGNAECWGDDTYDQAEDHAGPYVQVVVGSQHTCALRSDGTVDCWGRNQYGQSTPATGRFTKLAAGSYTSCGLRDNGDVECWGNSDSGQGGVTRGPFIDVAVGTEHVCALRRDRSLQCWGGTTYGQVDAPSGAYVSVDAGSFHTCALATNGTAACWGQNNYGQATPLQGPFVKITAAREHSCGMTLTGAVECFGRADGNRTVGLAGGAVRVGVRYPATGDATFEWSSVIRENSLYVTDAEPDSLTLAPAPRFRIPQAVWAALSATAQGEEFVFRIQRHTGDRLLDVVERSARFSDSPLTGKITYQSYGTRRVLNSVGTYENTTERWGAAVFAYDVKSRSSSIVSGFTSPTAAADGGCRGCHSAGAHNGLVLTGLDNRIDAALLVGDGPNWDEAVLPEATQERGGGVWAAIHPSLPLALTSRGPSPCAEAWGNSGSCAASAFADVAGQLTGSPYALQAPPGGMVGAAWFDANNDGILESSSSNEFLDLTAERAGATAGSVDASALRAAMPVFSPEGDRVAFVHYAGELRDGVGEVHWGDRRSLGMMDFDPDDVQLYNFQRLTNEADEPCDVRFDGVQGCADVWPSFTPRGHGVVFQRQVFANGSIAATAHSDLGGTRSGCEAKDQASCDDGAKGELWWVSLDSDGQPTGRYRLERANGVVGPEHLVTQGTFTQPGVSHSDEVEPLLNYQPSVAPRSAGSHHWVAFTSRRAYGNVATLNPWWSDPRVHPIGHDIATKKLWVSALGADVGAGDPSAPAFYLEGQEPRGSNGRPIWVSEQCVEPSEMRSEANRCESDADCCGAPQTARCDVELPLTTPTVRHCVPVDEAVCVDADSPRLCRDDEECCGFDAGERCASGRCVVPPGFARRARATFVRDYKAECPYGTAPQWKFVEWQASLPTGTSIRFDVASAPSQDELEGLEGVTHATANPPDTQTWTTVSTDEQDSIHSNLVAEGSSSMEWLRVWITLRADESQAYTPTLKAWRLVYDCADAF